MTATMKSPEEDGKSQVPSSPTRAFAGQSSGAVPQSAFDATMLPQAAGNLAVQALLRAGALRAKFEVGGLDDPEERDADQMATSILAGSGKAPCACGGACQSCRSSTKVQRKADGAPGAATHIEAFGSGTGQPLDRATQTFFEVPYAPPSVYAALASPGRPLDAATRAYFEPRLGAGLEAVRVHDDPSAAASASDVSARAYAVGNDIVLGGGSYQHDDPAARTVLAHELVHVMQQTPDRPVLRRFPSCSRLLSARGGAFVAEDSVQEFLADEMEAVGETERELRVPGASAAPWRTDGRDDTVIDPQNVHEWIWGQVDIALLPGDLALEFLEVKRASWPGAEFAENQVVNYVYKGNAAIFEVQRNWRRRTGNPNAIITSVREMPESRYVPPQGPVDIDGQQVMLAWCRSGVMVFKSLDVDNEELLYCGISDRGRTDAFIGRMLGQAEEMVASAVRRRLQELFPGDHVNIRPLLDKIREKLQSTIRSLLAEAINAVCAAALEVTVAAVLAELRKSLWKNNDLVDGLLWKLSPQGEGLQLHLGEVAAKSAAALTAGAIIWELLSLVPAFI